MSSLVSGVWLLGSTLRLKREKGLDGVDEIAEIDGHEEGIYDGRCWIRDLPQRERRPDELSLVLPSRAMEV